jgi:hypothetical protein
LRRIADIGERDKRDMVKERRSERPPQLDHRPRFADAAGAADRDDAMRAGELGERSEISAAADKSRRRLPAGCSAGLPGRPCPRARCDEASMQLAKERGRWRALAFQCWTAASAERAAAVESRRPAT